MLVKQISVFLENKEGRVAQVTQILSDSKINIRALSIAEKALKDEGFTVSITEVIAISIEDEPGGLAKALELLHENKISVEYIYAFISKTSHRANVILRVESCEKAIESLETGGFLVLTANEVYDQ